jgi:hypothetical protein
MQNGSGSFCKRWRADSRRRVVGAASCKLYLYGFTDLMVVLIVIKAAEWGTGHLISLGSPE